MTCQSIDAQSDRPYIEVFRGGRAIGQRPAVVLGTHCRPLVGHHRGRGDGVVQLPSPGAGAGWSVPASPAVCCTAATGAGTLNWRATKSAAWSAIPLFLYELCAARSRPPG